MEKIKTEITRSYYSISSLSSNAIIYNIGLGIRHLLNKSKAQYKGWFKMSGKRAKKATSSRRKHQWKAATAHSCWDPHFLLSGPLRKADIFADKTPVVSERQCLLVLTGITLGPLWCLSEESKMQSGMLPSKNCQLSYQSGPWEIRTQFICCCVISTEN